MDIFKQPYISECSCSGSSAEQKGDFAVIKFLVHFHLMQLLRLHLLGIPEAFEIFSKISKALSTMSAKWQYHYNHCLALCRDVYPVIMRAIRQLTFSIMVYLVESQTRFQSRTDSALTCSPVVFQLPWQYWRLRL